MAEPQKIESGDPVRKLSGRYLKWTAYGLLILGAGLLQMAPRVFPAVFGARPLLLIPIVVSIAMFEGPVGGAAAGIAGGLLWDLYADRLFGFSALFLMAICCACGLEGELKIENGKLSFHYDPETEHHAHDLLSGKFIHADDIKENEGKLMEWKKTDEFKQKKQAYIDFISSSKPE